jgi:hypothetical protein
MQFSDSANRGRLSQREGNETKKERGLDGFGGDKGMGRCVGAFSGRGISMKWKKISLVPAGRRVVVLRGWSDFV